jgi:hypothetical protein
VAFYTLVLGNTSTLPNMVAALLAAVGIVGLLMWKPATQNGAARTDRAAVATLLAALLTTWALGMALGGFIAAISAGYLFHPRYFYLWLNVPVAGVLAWLSFSVIAGQRAKLPRFVNVLLLAVSALLCVAHLITLRSYDPTGRLPGFLYAIPVACVVANIGAAILAAFRRDRAPEQLPSKETAIA